MRFNVLALPNGIIVLSCVYFGLYHNHLASLNILNSGQSEKQSMQHDTKHVHLVDRNNNNNKG